MTTTDRIIQLSRLRRRQLAEADDTTRALREAVRAAIAEGMSEVRAAEHAGVTRMTVRAWTGKPAR